MKDWRKILESQRSEQPPMEPFQQPPCFELCLYYEGCYLRDNPAAGVAAAERRAAAFAYALERLPLDFAPEQEFFGGVETFRSRRLPAGVTKEDYDSALEVFGREGGKRNFTVGYDHTIPDYNRLMERGLGDFIRRAREADASNSSPVSRGMLVALEAIASFARRAADRWEEREPRAAARLRVIAEEPPSDLAEALQLMWLIHVLLEAEGRRHNALGRMDQFLLKPYLASELESDAACDLLCHIFAKVDAFCEVTNICVGGVTTAGGDASNDISYLTLKAVGMVRSPHTNLSARLHDDTPEDFLMACVNLIKTGIGFPAVFNDNINVEMLRRLGIPLEAARDYALVGCVECVVPGRQVAWSDGRFNLPQVFCETVSRLQDFESYEDLWTDLADNTRAGLIKYRDEYNAKLAQFPPERFPDPVLSALTRDCIQRGRDINDGGAEFPRLHGVGMMGLGTLADSLAAVKTLVFDSGRVARGELAAALAADFQGYEELRQILIDEEPKYGNDDDLTNSIAAAVVELCGGLCAELRTEDGGYLQSCMASNIQNISAGSQTGATADGRRAGSPLSDAASPSQGKDRKGPTAFVNSIISPDYSVQNCTVVNMRFLPDHFVTDEGARHFALLLRRFVEGGGHEMQFNVTSNDLLLKAMENPEDYGDLIVRVSGFSAFFTTLDRKVQLDIINRNAHRAG